MKRYATSYLRYDVSLMPTASSRVGGAGGAYPSKLKIMRLPYESYYFSQLTNYYTFR